VDATVQVVMPQMGDSVSEGTILEWHKSEGDPVSQDETLVEISTDKVDAEVPAPVAGTVVKVFAGEGETVSVGAVLAEIAPTNGARPAAPAEPAAAQPEAPAEPAAAQAEAPADPVAAQPEARAEPAAQAEAVDIVMPAMGES